MLWLTNKNHFRFQTVTRKILDYLLLPLFFSLSLDHTALSSSVTASFSSSVAILYSNRTGQNFAVHNAVSSKPQLPSGGGRSVSIIVCWRALDAGTQIKQHSDGGTSLLQTSWVLVKTSLPSITDIKSTDTRQCHMSWGWGIPNILAESGMDGVKPLSPLTPGPETRLGSYEMMSSKNVR